jgi:hypothetical protein
VAESLASAKANAPGQPAVVSSSVAARGVVTTLLDLLRGDNPLQPDPGERALAETVEALRRVTGGLLLPEQVLKDPASALELELINEGWLEPAERVDVYKSDEKRFTWLLTAMADPSSQVTRASTLP